MMLLTQPTTPECRVAKVPACEPDECAANGNDIQAVGQFQMHVRDKIDFRVDFSAWVVANGNPVMTGATFAVASGSPQTPVIEGQAFNATGMAAVVLSAGASPEAGHAYYLDVTAQFAATIPVAPDTLSIPARKLVRRIHVVVVAG